MIRPLVVVVLAILTAWAVDFLSRRRGLDPPGFENPARRWLAGAVLSLVFSIGIFLPALYFDQPPEIEFESLSWTSVFDLQAILLLALVGWYALGYLGLAASDARDPLAPAPAQPGWAKLFGLSCRRPRTEIWIGIVGGAAAWLAVIVTATLAAVVLTALGGEQIFGDGAQPEVIVWMAGLPVAVRLAISLSAGVVEELFFRGFLQKRVGLAFSTLLFVGGHLAYGQPFMLFGITLLSLFYGYLARRRRNIVAAITAHALFDAVQLLVVIPAALHLSPQDQTLSFLSGLPIW